RNGRLQGDHQPARQPDLAVGLRLPRRLPGRALAGRARGAAARRPLRAASPGGIGVLTAAMVLGALLAVLAVWFVARPFLAGEGGDDRYAEPDPARLAHEERRDRALAAPKELEFDHRTGKVSDDDYRLQVGELRRAAADALRALDAGTTELEDDHLRDRVSRL